MDRYTGSGEGESKEDLSVFTRDIAPEIAPTDPRFWEEPPAEYEDNPLALLAANLAISILYIEEGKGGFCDDCTCPGGWHCTTETGECELCFCMEKHTKPIPIYIPSAPMRIRKYEYSPYRTRENRTLEASIGFERGRERSRDARAALQELTE